MNEKARLLEDELEFVDGLILASGGTGEDWHKSYAKAPKQLAKLIRTEAKMAKAGRKYFRELADRAPDYVNWAVYQTVVVKADKLEVNVMFHEDSFFETEDTEFMRIMYDPVAIAMELGALAGEEVYSIPLGLNGGSAAIQSAARGQIAELIGKKLDKDGNITNNPNAKYNINEVTRGSIEQSIRTSLNLGLSTEEAASRLVDLLDDPSRAQRIANTESVNAYQRGQRAYASGTGAIGKEWQSVNPDDECGDNEDAGVIAIDDEFPSGDIEPTAHPNCRCNVRYVYAEEADSEGYDL